MTSLANTHATPGAVARSFEQAPVELEPVAGDGMPDGQPPPLAPWSIRVCLWMVLVARKTTVASTIRAFSRLARRPVVWTLMLYPKVYGFVVAVTGGRVEHGEYEQRNGECAICDGRITKAPGWFARRWASYKDRTAKPRHYCGPCICPLWFFARLAGWLGKNRWRKHYCPRENHAATDYPTFITISPSGCGQRAFKIPGGRARSNAETGGQHVGDDS